MDAIDADSTAVLAFDDGTRVPCVRYIMRHFCSVVAELLDATLCDLDPRGRSIIPVPGQPVAPFALAVDILHGAAVVTTLTLEQVEEVLACMDYLGATAWHKDLHRRLWQLLDEPGATFQDIMRHAPRLLRDPDRAPDVVHRLVRLLPTWADFLGYALKPLESSADMRLLDGLVAYATNFFPAMLVVDWAIGAAAQLPHATHEDVLRLATFNGEMFHPHERASTLRRLAEVCASRRWDTAVTRFAKSVAQSLERFDVLPWTRARTHGTQISFMEMPLTSVSVVLPKLRLPATVKLTPWLKVCFCQDGRLDAAFQPRSIDDESKTCSAVQLRIMCFNAPHPSRGAIAEAWFLFDVLDGVEDTYTLSHATATLGHLSAVTGMLRLKTARCLRFDFFYGKESALLNPFDPVAAPLWAAM